MPASLSDSPRLRQTSHRGEKACVSSFRTHLRVCRFSTNPWCSNAEPSADIPPHRQPASWLHALNRHWGRYVRRCRRPVHRCWRKHWGWVGKDRRGSHHDAGQFACRRPDHLGIAVPRPRRRSDPAAAQASGPALVGKPQQTRRRIEPSQPTQPTRKIAGHAFVTPQVELLVVARSFRQSSPFWPTAEQRFVCPRCYAGPGIQAPSRLTLMPWPAASQALP